MGSEMCIRDRASPSEISRYTTEFFSLARSVKVAQKAGGATAASCLLYTSDAADERSSVDLGGRRIIKKKKKLSN